MSDTKKSKTRKLYKVITREVCEVVHYVSVKPSFKLPDEDNLDDWADQIGKQDSSPVEFLDAQIDCVLRVEEVVTN